MTETEARQFMKRFHDLCREFERDTGSDVERSAEEQYKQKRLKFLVGNFSLKISC